MMLKDTWLEPLAWWAWASIAVTGLCGLVYVEAQQMYRQSANDPQVQLAEDIAIGAMPVPGGRIDMGTSLAPFVIVYDTSGEPIGGNGYLGLIQPKLPDGVLQNASWWAHGHTW